MTSKFLRSGLIVAALLTLAACATRTAPEPGPLPSPSPAPAPVPAQPETPPARAESFAELPGWAEDDHAAAFEAFRTTCGVARDPALSEVCRRARASGPLDRPRARAFFEENFRPELVIGEGILTAYFSPVYEARDRPDAEFSAPVRPKPSDLVMSGPGGKDAMRRLPDGRLAPYADRTEIELAGAGAALAWMRPEEHFFLQVQGSGVLVFPDGRRSKAVFAATNGRPFAGIANPMRERGLLPADNTSGEAIRAWLAANRGPAADEIMRINPRYVFFTLAPDDGRHPAGAAGVPLPPGRAVAVDAGLHALGQPFFIDGVAPILSGAFPTYRRTVMALDVGGAIKGPVRADLYLGQGPQAGLEAGRVRHTLRMHRLVPKVGPGW
ncbi:MAG: MltA domain-containing protein [Phenylobacterium sp.]|uniref:MltA domain-containing protein n=1 Tax=Phenylobacterium sp. TaxID=1871053 RepID=UPI003918C630